MAVTHVAFLRAINVTGRFIKMVDLAEHFRALGCEEVSTHIQSGNVMFNAAGLPSSGRPATLADELAQGLATRLGFTSEVFLRTPAQLAAILARAEAAAVDLAPPGEVNVVFLPQPLSAEQQTQLAALRTEQDDLQHHGSEVYWRCLVRQSASKFSNSVVERRLRLRATLRRTSMLRGLLATL